MNLLTKYQQSTRLQWIVRHTVFWLIMEPIIFYQVYLYGFTEGFNLTVGLEWFPFMLLMVYTFLYALLPLLLRLDIVKFFFGLVLWMAILFTGVYFMHYYVILPINNGTAILHRASVSGDYTFTMVQVIMFLSGTCVAGSLKLLRFWYYKERNNEQLANETMVAELQLLKGQVHPHFLFNTLNNLYSLTLKKSKKAPEVVVKLSELLYYMLHECSNAEVSVLEEVQMIENYIELEKLRYGKRLNIKMEIKGELSEKNIAPLLLIPFVENAFKHGSSEQTEAAFIEIFLYVDDDLLSFKICNSKNESPVFHSFGGIGLTNVKKRLQLIYPGQYELNLLPGKNKYEVDLVIYFAKKSKNKFADLSMIITS